MNPEEQVRAVEMLRAQIAECSEPKIGMIVIQTMMKYNGIETTVGAPEVIEVCEEHLFLFLELVLDPAAVENFKQWYSIREKEMKRQERLPAKRG